MLTTSVLAHLVPVSRSSRSSVRSVWTVARMSPKLGRSGMIARRHRFKQRQRPLA